MTSSVGQPDSSVPPLPPVVGAAAACAGSGGAQVAKASKSMNYLINLPTKPYDQILSFIKADGNSFVALSLTNKKIRAKTNKIMTSIAEEQHQVFTLFDKVTNQAKNKSLCNYLKELILTYIGNDHKISILISCLNKSFYNDRIKYKSCDLMLFARRLSLAERRNRFSNFDTTLSRLKSFEWRKGGGQPYIQEAEQVHNLVQYCNVTKEEAARLAHIYGYTVVLSNKLICGITIARKLPQKPDKPLWEN